MFSMKFFNNKNGSVELIDKTVTNIVRYISEVLSFENTRIISDKNSTEVISGRESIPSEEQVVVELLIRKNIIINISDFKDRDSLDKHISKIKHFCDQAKEIEDLKYLPLNMR